MKSNWKFKFVLFAIAAVFLGSSLPAQDTKDQPKPKTKKADDIVVNGELLAVDLKDRLTNTHCKTFTFKMEKDKGYQFQVSSKAFPPYLRIENRGGQIGAAGTARFDPANGQSAFIVHRPSKTEDFEIIVTSQFANRVGKFTLTIKELTGDEGKPIELKLQNGQVAYNGMLTPADPRYNGTKIHKYFIVQLEKGCTYQIDHMSQAFDAYLYLQDPSGRVIAQDDDGGVGLNSRIAHRVTESGKYRIVATSLGGSSTGQFNFTIRHTAGQPEKK